VVYSCAICCSNNKNQVGTLRNSELLWSFGSSGAFLRRYSQAFSNNGKLHSMEDDMGNRE